MPDVLRQGARGVDDFVVADGGNAYIIRNADWVLIEDGPSQLVLSFDTLNCVTPKSNGPVHAAASPIVAAVRNH